MKLLFTIILTILSIDSIACSCGGFNKISAQDILYYDLIIKGKILSVKKVLSEDYFYSQKEVSVLVLRRYFGHGIQDTIIVNTGMGGGDCGLDFKVGEKWLIFSDSFENDYYAGLCSKSLRSSKKNALKFNRRKKFLAKLSNKTKYIKDQVQGYTIEGQLSQGKPDGKWFRHKGKDTLEMISFKQGKLNGKWIEFHEQGKSRTIREFKEGKQHGVYEYYNQKGMLRTRITYAQGKRHGQSFEYYDSGKLYRRSEYSYGALVEEKIFEHPKKETTSQQIKSIDFSKFNKDLMLSLDKPDLKWAIPNSVLVSPDNKYFLVSYDFNPTFFELYETNKIKKVNEFKTRGHAYLSSSFFHEGIIYIDIGKKINIGREKIQFMTYELSTGQMEKVKCEDSPRGCEYSISSPFRNDMLREYITNDEQLMFKVENSAINVYRIIK